MPRVPRTTLPDGFFHVVCRGVAAAGSVFRDEDDRATFVDLVWRTARTHGWTCHAFSVLGSHCHLVLETPREGLSRGLQRLTWLYAMHFNAKYSLHGHVFCERFSARVIESEQYLYDACTYVVLNPVKAGLCDRVEEWPWSYSSFGVR